MSQASTVPYAGMKAAARKAWKIVSPQWRFGMAQRYEFASAKGTINRSFQNIFRAIEEDRQRGGIWQSENDDFFQGDKEAFSAFVEHVRDRTSLEIGSGPFGYLAPCAWIKRRVVIDPLVDKYRDHQLQKFRRTLWTPAIETHATPAEQIIPSLVGKVDGAIICQNALDHTEDPIGVLDAISEYAAPGCYFLFWTDLWHGNGGDIGHRNITKSVNVMPKIIKGLGFEIIKRGEHVRDGSKTTEFGCLARKL